MRAWNTRPAVAQATTALRGRRKEGKGKRRKRQGGQRISGPAPPRPVDMSSLVPPISADRLLPSYPFYSPFPDPCLAVEMRGGSLRIESMPFTTLRFPKTFRAPEMFPNVFTPTCNALLALFPIVVWIVNLWEFLLFTKCPVQRSRSMRSKKVLQPSTFLPHTGS